MKRIAILGSTGSIGTQAVEVAAELGESVRVVALSANRKGEALAAQARALGVRSAYLDDDDAYGEYKAVFDEMGVELLTGPEGLRELIGNGRCDLVLNAVVGAAGLPATMAALRSRVPLALSNKESLVIAGTLVMEESKSGGVPIIPVDSEHSAVFQCLQGEDYDALRKIILTASGGPFRDTPAGELEEVTVPDALSHPTWEMGPKITVDSATLMNKGLEVLEAHHLFDVALDRIEVMIHHQSVVHSMVEMIDGSVLAHMGVPDMRVPIQYAMTFPERVRSPASFLSLVSTGELTFTDVDDRRFPCLGLAYRAGEAGGTYPAAMNAANEEAVAAFLEGRIRFTHIPVVVERVLDGHAALPGGNLDEVMSAESEARRYARRTVERLEVAS